MLIEVIAVTLDDVLDAGRYGADRIELCSSMDADGLTPSIGLIRAASTASNIPVNVMVRNHNESFIYSDTDKAVMLDEISFIRETKASGIVIGMLDENNAVDETFLKAVNDAAGHLDIVFHKAFDQIDDKDAALKTLGKFPKVKTILTAGGPGSAGDNFNLLSDLHKSADTYGITIMPGGGLKADAVSHYRDTFTALHFGTGVRENQSFAGRLSREKLKQLKEL